MRSTLKVCLFWFVGLSSACSEIDGPIVPQSSTVESSPKNRVTDDIVEFAAGVRAIGNNNELLIALKDPSEVGFGRESFSSISAENLIAVPRGRSSARQSTSGFARASSRAKDEVERLLLNHQVQRRVRFGALPIISVTIPDEKLDGVLNALLNSPYVDYIEANRRRSVRVETPAMVKPTFASLVSNASMGQPNGLNPFDDKHYFHSIAHVWDYTRGAGAKVGIMDSGLVYDRTNSVWHPDAALITSSKGIDKRGFVDDYAEIPNCDVTGGQYNGTCVPWDDHPLGHGTRMVGIVGSNDNDIGQVGIMPDGLTISMKIIQNSQVNGDGCNNGTGTECIEDDDFVAGVDWAIRNGLDVLSMSFNDEFGSSVYNALRSAFYDHDIL